MTEFITRTSLNTSPLGDDVEDLVALLCDKLEPFSPSITLSPNWDLMRVTLSVFAVDEVEAMSKSLQVINNTRYGYDAKLTTVWAGLPSDADSLIGVV